MMWGYDIGWGGWLLMTFGMVLWIALLVVMGWVIIRWLDSKLARPTFDGDARSRPIGPRDPPTALCARGDRYGDV